MEEPSLRVSLQMLPWLSWTSNMTAVVCFLMQWCGDDDVIMMQWEDPLIDSLSCNGLYWVCWSGWSFFDIVAAFKPSLTSCVWPVGFNFSNTMWKQQERCFGKYKQRACYRYVHITHNNKMACNTHRWACF